MRSRRRFHGYCPPTVRKVGEVAAASTEDDYTCGMSALTLRVGFQTAKQIHGGPLLSFDCDEDSLDSCELDTTANNSPIKLPLQARLVVAATAEKDNDGAVPALVEEQGECTKTATEVNEAAERNDDSGKASPVVERLAAHENESEKQCDPAVRLFDDSDDDDDDDDDDKDNSNGRNKRDTIMRKRSSLSSSSNILAPSESISKKSTPSVRVSFSGGETKDIDVPTNVGTDGTTTSKDSESISNSNNGNNNGKTSFLMLRLNYLIVTVAIMLADGLQGEFVHVLCLVDAKSNGIFLTPQISIQVGSVASCVVIHPDPTSLTLSFHTRMSFRLALLVCIGRHTSLRPIRRVWVFCGVTVLPRFSDRSRHIPHHWSHGGSYRSEEGRPYLLCSRDLDQHA